MIARIEMEIEHARATVGLPVDALLIQPLKDDLAERLISALPPTVASIEPVTSLMMGEACRSCIDDPTRAWPANTREAYETSRRLAIAVIGETTPDEGGELLCQMKDLLPDGRRGRVKAQLPDDEGEVTGDRGNLPTIRMSGFVPYRAPPLPKPPQTLAHRLQTDLQGTVATVMKRLTMLSGH